MNATRRWRVAARLGLAAAGVIVGPLLTGCGYGSFLEQQAGGEGGGGTGGSGTGGSGTLVQMLMTPPRVTLVPGSSTQFAVSGTLSDGSRAVPEVTYRATGGTINVAGLFTAGPVGVDTVFATDVGGPSGVPPCCTDTSVVTVTTNPPTALTLLAEPGGAVSGQAFAQQPVVELLNGLSQVVVESGVTVSVAIASGTGTLTGTTTITTDGNGRAVFTDLAITGSGTVALQFTSPGLTAVTSATLTVSP